MDGRGGFAVEFANSTDVQFRVQFAPALHGRVPHADRAIEDNVETHWQAALKRNPKMFNGSKFRYAGSEYSAQKNTLTMYLGRTDYRTFQGTHGVPRPLQTFGLAGLARPLGNTIVVQTSDGCVAVLHRNGAVGEGCGTAVFPGGHPEPKDAGVETADAAEGGDAGIDARVHAELWNAAWREVLEELFLSSEQAGPPSDMVCLGLVSRARDAKVCQVFYMRADVEAKVVEEQYVAGNVSKEESCGVFLIPCKELRTICEQGKVHSLRLMPECMGALKLWLDYSDKGGFSVQK